MSNNVDTGLSCAICLNPLNNPSVDDQELLHLPCHSMHVYHRHCAIEWFRDSNLCPLCRGRVTCLNNRWLFPNSSKSIPNTALTTFREMFGQTLEIVSPKMPAEEKTKLITNLGAEWDEWIGVIPPLIEGDQESFKMVLLALVFHATSSRSEDVLRLLLDPSVLSLTSTTIDTIFSRALQKTFLSAIPILLAYWQATCSTSGEKKILDLLRGRLLMTAVQHARIDIVQFLLQDGPVSYGHWASAFWQALSQREFRIAKSIAAGAGALRIGDLPLFTHNIAMYCTIAVATALFAQTRIFS